MAASRDARATLLVVAGLIVAVAGLATIGVHAHFSPDGRAANDGFLVAICMAGAAVGFARYRSSGNTHPLFVAAGLLVIATQTLVFDQNWILSNSTMPWEAITLPALGWFFGWLLAAVGFVLARPWWDRRGRKPIHAPLVLGVAAGALFVIDLLLVVLRHSLPHAKNIDLKRGQAFALATPALWIVGGAAIALLIVAAWREWRIGGDVRTPAPWLAAAWLVAAAAQVVLLARPISYRPLIVPADVLFCAAAAIALIAFLAPQRAEASRARRATDQAQQVMGGRAEIAAMIAHEVRGPVTTIRGLAGTALVHYDRLGDPERREFLDLIEQESRRLLATVTQASTALKVDASSVSYDIRPQNLAATIREGIALADVGQHPVAVDVPDGVETALDRRWVAEVVRQLVDNAAKFSPAESSISVGVRADEGWVTIEVTDEGPGIPTEQREAVFEKFTTWRPDGYETAAGSGLGLFMVRGIVQAHSGTIDIAAVPGDGGTMLRVRLPMEE
jgi:signal transduction histidine kinase